MQVNFPLFLAQYIIIYENLKHYFYRLELQRGLSQNHIIVKAEN